jgi:hypothetical protein
MEGNSVKFLASRRLVTGLAALATILTLSTVSVPANAGNLWLTGHDADFHCRFGDQCNHFGIALDFVRLGAPDPTKPLLFLSAQDHDLVAAEGQANTRARNTVEGAGSPFPFVLLDPLDAAFATTTLSTDDFSAIIFASDDTCGGCDLNEFGSTPHSDAINLRTADIEAFFNDGGGLAYFAGAENRDIYYASVPIPAAAAAVSPPFTLTAAGVAIGLDALGAGTDTNCCATHNSFGLPGAGSPLTIAEFDESGLAETLFARGATIDDGEIKGGSSVPEPASIALLALGLMGLGFSAHRKKR